MSYNINIEQQQQLKLFLRFIHIYIFGRKILDTYTFNREWRVFLWDEGLWLFLILIYFIIEIMKIHIRKWKHNYIQYHNWRDTEII